MYKNHDDVLPPPPPGKVYKPLRVGELAKLKDTKDWPVVYLPGLEELL